MKTTLLSVAIGSAVAASYHPASADTSHQSASECKVAQYSALSADGLIFTFEGVLYNAWATTPPQPMYVVCPIRWYGSSSVITPATYTVGYVDADPSQTVSCSMYGQDIVGNTWYGATTHSCGAPGGCSSITTYSTTPGTVDTLAIPGFCTPGGTCPTLWSVTMGCTIPSRYSGSASELHDIVTTM